MHVLSTKRLKTLYEHNYSLLFVLSDSFFGEVGTFCPVGFPMGNVGRYQRGKSATTELHCLVYYSMPNDGMSTKCCFDKAVFFCI